MTNAWFLGAGEGVPQNENEVRSTVEPVRSDGESSEQTDSPDFNEQPTDDSGELVGLSPREAGSDTRESESYRPWWATFASQVHNIVVDRQVASSGTAAQREEAGQQGHGTVHYTKGITPELREGAAYGNEYFMGLERDIQEGAEPFMAPVSTDNWGSAIAQRTAENHSRKASANSLYAAFLSGD